MSEKMGKKLMLGNHAVARGLYEAGVRVVSSYPGTPSTEITIHAAGFEREKMWVEWSPNEKVGAEVAIGASIAGARAFSGMKHVGLNVAADPLYTASYTGVNGGLVFAVADDMGMHSSQNEQDSRHHAIAAKVPMLEPSSAHECKEFTKLAFEISEQFDTPVLLRLSTRTSHSQGVVEEQERVERDMGDYKKDAEKYVMMPTYARAKHPKVEERTLKLIEYAETSPLNKIEINNPEIGIITSGTTYQFSKEAFGNDASYLKLGIVNPLPTQLILDFASKVKKLYVAEELDDIIETHCRKIGLSPLGKEIFTYVGEYSGPYIREKITGEKTPYLEFGEPIPVRPPILCAGCSHRSVFYVLKKLGVMVNGDIGCYTLGATPPLSAMDTCICMGAGVSALHGFNKARKDYENRAIGVVGDSTFIHNGITGLINIAYNRTNSTILIVDNSTTGMTGHQNNPANGHDIYGDFTAKVDLEMLCKSVGINRVVVIEPSDMAQTERVLKQELDANEPSVIIARMPCALLKTTKHKAALSVNEKCNGCKMCMRIGCPALTFADNKAKVNSTLCVGCGVCTQMCKVGAIGGEHED
ncbi:MAG: indolepyruvate ferredoxin oxidoreductase subunit alpha [Oscillospiraceae bacterium]|nr:indolepyruvate ferredoxin oxidoreductase subunit alpha [Oscillospiraceae bacterium]